MRALVDRQCEEWRVGDDDSTQDALSASTTCEDIPALLANQSEHELAKGQGS